MMVETYLRRGRRELQRLSLDPRVRGVGGVLVYGGSGFLLSAAGLGNYPQPLAMGLICACTGWRTLVMSIGAMVGYPTFWGSEGNPGILWSAAGGLLALLVGKREESREQPLMIPVIGAFLTAVAELCFRLILRDTAPVAVSALRVVLAGLAGVLFTQFVRGRDPVTDWLVGGIAVLALAQVPVPRFFGPGYVAAGIMAVGGAFPGAAMAGLGLDLAQVTAVPMTAVMALAFIFRMIPFAQKWQHYAAPAFAYLAVCAACGIWDPVPLPGLALGGALSALLPPRAPVTRRRGETGAAQVRLELGAELLATMEQLLSETAATPVDGEVLLEEVRKQACAGCPARKGCEQRRGLTLTHVLAPLEADCKKQSRLIPELDRAARQWKLWKADRQRRQEYREALGQQYRFLSSYLRSLADRLPRGAKQTVIEFRVEAAARSRGKERANGDRCLAFSGVEGRYYVLLCDGMGTGLGAAREGQSTAELLRQMLTAGFPADHALHSLNSLLVLRGCGGAVTVDLAEIHLDTGHAHVYKWGAAPSWVLTRKGAEKIGTATPPPGLSVEKTHMAVEKLSLRRGEVLILVSDGVEGEMLQHLSDLSPDAPPGELAAKIAARGGGNAEDDATAAVIRLRPTGVMAS